MEKMSEYVFYLNRYMDFAIVSDPLREQASRTMVYNVLGAGREQSMIFRRVVIIITPVCPALRSEYSNYRN